MYIFPEAESLVTIHKKARKGSWGKEDITNNTFSPQVTPTKKTINDSKETPEHVRYIIL